LTQLELFNGQVLKFNGIRFAPGTDATTTPGSLGSIDEHSDVILSTPIADGQALIFDGTNWINKTIQLGENTKGSYVQSLAAGTGITLTNNEEIGIFGEGTTPIVAVNTAVIAPLYSPTFTGTVSGVTKSMVGLGNVDNTSDANKPISTATQAALDLKAPLASPTFTGLLKTNDLIVSGNLVVNGDTVTLNAETLVVEDKTIELGTSLTPSNTTADGSGIVVPDGSANKTFTWVNSISSWSSSENINLALDKVIKINGIEILSSTNYIGKAATATMADQVVANSVTPTMLQEGPARSAFRSEILTITNATHTLLLSDLSKLIIMNNSSSMTVTVPSEANTAFMTGDRIDVTRYGTGSLTFNSQEGVSLRATPGLKLRAQYSTATLTKLATNEWLIVGDLAA
jgi:hypothetical protein